MRVIKGAVCVCVAERERRETGSREPLSELGKSKMWCTAAALEKDLGESQWLVGWMQPAGCMFDTPCLDNGIRNALQKTQILWV